LPAPDDLALLLDAARRGGEVALSYWRASPASWDKGQGLGPVSEADLAVDRTLSAVLRGPRPDYGWLSEESDDDRRRLSAGRVFIVDPIDGTRGFLEGARTWAISLAIAHEGRIEAAVVALPAEGRTYSAVTGAGARCNGKPLGVNDREQVAGARVLAARPSLAADIWPAGPPPVERHFRPSLAYRLCLVAEGRFDGMMTYRDCWEWDIAAGALIAAEAGARVSDRSGAALAFNTPAATTPGAVAAAPALHGALLPPAQTR
jgi:myo-inositol-1(or 4)-monophosphatase